MSDSFSGEFIFVTSETTPEKRVKRAAWPARPYEKTEYDTIDDDEKEWVLQEMREQITSTISSIKAKKLKNIERVYVVLGVTAKFLPNEKKSFSEIRKKVFYKNMLTVLERLSAEVIAYLNVEHTKLLVSCPLSKLNEILKKEKYSKKYFQGVKRISPLLLGEQISENLKTDYTWINQPKDVIIQLIPNLKPEETREYASDVLQHLQQEQITVKSYDNENLLIANLQQESATQLLSASNFVFKISEVPEASVENFAILCDEKGENQIAKHASYSTRSRKQKLRNLPIICVLDSGLNDVPQLNGLIVAKDGHRRFTTFDDDYNIHGHGTPIAYLAIFGETSSDPKARVISYKIYSDKDKRLFPESYRLAMSKYSSLMNPNYSPIFLSSINFKKYDDEITASIDRLIQENNVCAVFSAGNIDPNTVSDYVKRNIPCSLYVCNHPIQDPAQAVNAVAVGAIAKKDSENSISKKDDLSPFTRCGTINSNLYECPKPEFVQHGGNCCKDGTKLGVTSVTKHGKIINAFLGTSFSAPIFAHHLSEIYAKYKNSFNNSETLKAIALASSNGFQIKCKGFGEATSFTNCNKLQALVCSEGAIPLQDTISEKHYRTNYKAKMSIAIPKLVNSISMFLVHSDNNFRATIPCLNTYLKVKAKKTGRDYGYVHLDNPEEIEKKAHMKIFNWSFKTQSMEGVWDFYIEPEVTADMLPEHKRATTVRYGCAFLIESKTPSRRFALSDEIHNLNKQLGVIV